MATGALSAAKDPWAGIRQLHFGQYDVNHPAADIGDGQQSAAYTEKLWGVNQDALAAGGFNTKYNRVEEVEPGLFKVVLQQPGAHKYDTAEAYYKVDPETGMGTMVEDPTATRQVSGREKWRDRFEQRILPIAGAVLGAGYGLGAMGYGSGIPGLSAAAAAPGAPGAAGAGGVNLGMGGATAGDFGMMIGADGAATYGGIGAAEAAGAATAAGGAGAGGGALSGLDAAMADVAKSGAITPDKMGSGMSYLDKALQAGSSLFSNDWLTTAMSLVGSGVQQYNIEKAAQDQRDWIDSKDIDRRRRQAPGALPAMKTTVYTKGGG